MLEIVTHCYAGKLPQYATFLRYQLSSLFLNPPTVKTAITVVYPLFDNRTVAVLEEFNQLNDVGVEVKHLGLPAEQVFRRSIGRNMAALETKADVVWFADTDYYFGQGCLDAANMESLWGTDDLIFPKTSKVHVDHFVGDEYVKTADKQKELLLTVDPKDFTLHRQSKAIGGIQIFKGDWLRKNGYLNDYPEFLRPSRTPFPDTKGDFRVRRVLKEMGGTTRGIDLPTLYRLRHTHNTYEPPKVRS